MKICFFSAEYPPETHSGGIGTYTHGMASALAGLGHEVHVIAATAKDGGDVQVDGVRVHRLKKRRMKPKELELLAYSHAAGKKVKQVGCCFDIVQAAEFGGEAFWYSLGKRAPLITRFATPFFLTERLNGGTIFGPRPVLNWLEKQQALRSDGLYTSTKALARVIAGEWGIGLSRVRVIPNGLDIARVVRLGTSNPCPDFLKDKAFLLYFGRLEERKGIRVLGNALPALLRRYPLLYMVFVGSDLGYHGSSFREYIQERSAEDRSRVLFFDNLPQEGLFPIVNRATMVILPSLWEAFGFVCVEAMALGRPVVATSGSGFEEIIVDEKSGFLVEPGNSEALARKISEGLDDAARLARVSEGAGRRARDFDAARIAVGLLDYYHEIRGAWLARRTIS